MVSIPPHLSERSASNSPSAAAAALDDEYGAMDKNDRIFELDELALESGLVLPQVRVAYRTWGALNTKADNTIFIAHALTGNAAADSWWGVLVGEARAFDPNKYFIVCANMLGSCYGTTGPLDTMPHDPPPAWAAPRAGTARAAAGNRYAADFPYCTVRDTVALHHALLQSLGVLSVHACVGGSAGGMQALEWAIMYPHYVKRVVAMACGAVQSPWQIGISESQRQAIYRDLDWNDGFFSLERPPSMGLSIARQQAMVWYRSQQAYDAKFGRDSQPPSPRGVAAKANSASGGGGAGAPPTYAVEGYLEHQGQKFLERFDANTYISLTRLIDSHDVGRGRGGVDAALSTILAPVLVIGISSDVLYPPLMQQELADKIPRSACRIVTSIQGHDGFLLEGERIGALVTAALEADTDADIDGTLNSSMSAVSSEDERLTPHDRTLRQTMALPRTTDGMNELLASKKRRPPALSPAQEWFFGI